MYSNSSKQTSQIACSAVHTTHYTYIDITIPLSTPFRFTQKAFNKNILILWCLSYLELEQHVSKFHFMKEGTDHYSINPMLGGSIV